ncbi:MAG TPA: methyltransferase domain-containing protein [Burkholderiales bacterium]|nr:methyltransferase domain-containing protein [Burkholderiales bacterium]
MTPVENAAPPPLITEEYRALQRRLHENPDYGVASLQYAPLVAEIVRQVGAEELLDYGAGKGRLGRALREQFGLALRIHHYDPAVPEWSAPPAPCRFVACIDVLEHIEPELLDNVLEDLRRVTLGVGVFTVHTGPAVKTLPDGRNAHLIQKPPEWWLPKLMARFDLVIFNRMPQGFWVAVQRKEQP